MYLGVKTGGYGQHANAIAPSLLENFLKLTYVVQIIYPITIALIKWSILAFYRRIFAVPSTKIPVYVIGAIVVSWLIACVSTKL